MDDDHDREARLDPAGPRMSRRTVLKAIGIGGGAVVLAGAGGVTARAGLNGVWNQGQGAPYELWSSWQDAPGLHALVAAGVLAANPHNLQPWAFELGDDLIDVFDDPSRAMPVNDADGRERAAGYGCAIQNIVVAARARGLDAEITPLPDGDPEHVARIAFRVGAEPTVLEQRLAAAIADRHSNRGPYTAQAVDQDILDALVGGAPGGATVHWITDAPPRATLGALIVEATQAIVDDEEMSTEAFAWFRNDRADIDRYRDGLTLDGQGLDPFTLFLAKILPAQSRTSGDQFWVNATRDVHTATAAAYGIVRVSDTGDPVARLDAGRLLQHVHLAATDAGLGMQHLNQITECIARDAATGAPDRFSARWAEATGIPAGEALLAFRVGTPQRTPNPSPRRPLADVLTA
ncbi:MAG: hypothetical protein WA006_10300 [Rhodoglobus sp.]